MSLVGIHGRRQHDQICAPHTFLGISYISIDRPQRNGRLEIFHSPTNADHMIGQGLAPENHAKRSAD
jgi:hypothetical protein